jgi:hypothetical protein
MTEFQEKADNVARAQIERLGRHAAPAMRPYQILAALDALPPGLAKITAHEGLSRAIRRQMHAAHAMPVEGAPV